MEQLAWFALGLSACRSQQLSCVLRIALPSLSPCRTMIGDPIHGTAILLWNSPQRILYASTYVPTFRRGFFHIHAEAPPAGKHAG